MRVLLGLLRRILLQVASNRCCLLDGVGEFVGEQLLAAAGRRVGDLVPEEDVVAGREGLGLDAIVQFGRRGPGVNPHTAEVGTERPLHLRPGGFGQRCAAAARAVQQSGGVVVEIASLRPDHRTALDPADATRGIGSVVDDQGRRLGGALHAGAGACVGLGLVGCRRAEPKRPHHTAGGGVGFTFERVIHGADGELGLCHRTADRDPWLRRPPPALLQDGICAGGPTSSFLSLLRSAWTGAVALFVSHLALQRGVQD